MCETDPDLIWMAWSEFGQTRLSGSKLVCWNHVAQFWQDTASLLPVSNFQTWFCSTTDVLDNTVQNQPWSDLVLADCVRFWPTGSGLEASWCVRIIWPASGQCFPWPSRSAPDANRIRHVYWVVMTEFMQRFTRADCHKGHVIINLPHTCSVRVSWVYFYFYHTLKSPDTGLASLRLRREGKMVAMSSHTSSLAVIVMMWIFPPSPSLLNLMCCLLAVLALALTD